MLHALALGADWVWLADDDGRPAGLRGARHAAGVRRRSTVWPRCRRWCATWTTRSGWRSRCAAGWCGGAGSASCAPTATEDLLPGIASLFNGALFRASTLEAVGVPDLRLFVRGDEVELHRRLVRSGLPFGTCLDAVYLHPQGGDEFKPILGGRMHTQYPDDATKRFFTYRNRGYLLSQPGMRKLLSAGVAAVRLVLPGVPARPGRPAGVDPAAAAWVVARSSKGLHSDVHRRGRAVEDDDAAPGATSSTASASASCGCTWAGRTSSSATAARCSARSGSPSPPAPRRSRWAGCTRSCSSSSCPSTCRTSRSGLIIWNLINASILEGADVFVANEGLIKQLPTPLSRARLPAGVAADDPVRAQHRHLRGHRDHLPASRGRGPTSRSSRRWR